MDEQPDQNRLMPPVDYEIPEPMPSNHFSLIDYVCAILIVGVVLLGCYLIPHWKP
jgi:hypothetical protein